MERVFQGLLLIVLVVACVVFLKGHGEKASTNTEETIETKTETTTEDKIHAVLKKFEKVFNVESEFKMATEEDGITKVIVKYYQKNYDKEVALANTLDLGRMLSEEIGEVSLEATWYGPWYFQGENEKAVISEIVFKHDTFNKIDWNDIIYTDVKKLADKYKENPYLN